MSTLITPEIVEQHGLSQDEYDRILKILGREPNLTELGIFSVMWSEHCSYKSSKVHLKKLPTQGKCVLQGPGENAGIVDIGEGWALAFKIESHNHPSFIEPYQGAATGVGGILRDIFTMGARPIANLNSLCFGSPQHPKTRFLVNGVVAGIAGYGNCVGVPTVGGEVYFHPSYNQNILVNAMTVGLLRQDRMFRGKAEGVGNPVIYVGSKTGRDGIHGATMASEEFGEGSEEKRPTVQVGDPFTEKLLLEACLELMEKDYLVGIQDMGAAGLTSSSVEMASRGGNGIELDLDRVPTREEGMNAYELMLSESQERMLMVVKRGCEDSVIEIFRKWDLDVAEVGKVTQDGKLRLKHHGQVVAEVPVDPLAKDVPFYQRPAREPAYLSSLNRFDLASLPLSKSPQNPPLPKGGRGDLTDYNSILQTLIASPNLSSRRWVWEQYDHMVMTNTVVLPGSDAAVLRLKESEKGIAMTVDCNSIYCHLNPREGAKIAVAEAARNLVCSGARPLALTNCLNFGNPEKVEVMWQFAEAIEGMREACLALNTPVTGGNVSFYNETKGEPIYPTPTIGMVGLLDKVSNRVTQFFKKKGDIILLAGETFEELGGSEYLETIFQRHEGPIPKLDLAREKKLQDFLLKAISQSKVKSAHDLSEGGLAIGLAECCISGEGDPLGLEVKLEASLRPDALLFGESQSRVLLSVARSDLSKVVSLAHQHQVPLSEIGKVGGSRFIIAPWIELPLDSLKRCWEEGFERQLCVES